MKFTKFLLEGAKEDIIVILNQMEEDELQEFGEWLYSDMFEYDEVDLDDEDELEESEDEKITKEEIIELLGTMSADELSYILDMISYEEDEDDHVEKHTDMNPNIQNESEELDEAVARRMSAKNRNKKKRKFMANSQADMRRTKVARKKDARMNRAKRKRDYRKNKVKKLAYAKSRKQAIDKGQHRVKLRKKA